MKKWMTVWLLASAFLVTSFIGTSSVYAAPRCGKKRKVMRTAGSKSLKRARKIARKKALRAARKRCGTSRRVSILGKRIRVQCKKRKGKGLKRCRAAFTYTCCKRTRKGKKRARPSKGGKACLRKRTVRAKANSKNAKVARRVARKKVRIQAKKLCGKRTPRYVSKWTYSCSRKGKRSICVARNAVRCCRRRLRRRRKKRKIRRKKKRRSSKRRNKVRRKAN